jgi:hypothetical protein
MGHPHDPEAPADPNPAVQAAQARSTAMPAGADFDAVLALTRLLVGGALEGSDELLRRLRRWEASPQLGPLTSPAESQSGRLRHALVGTLFEAEAWARFGVHAARRLSSPFVRLFLTDLPPILRATPAEPLVELGDALAARGQAVLDRWIGVGRDEERRGRRLARLAVSSMLEELLEYLAQNPEVRELIQQQSVGLADAAVDEVRDRSLSADIGLERLVHSMLRRLARERAPASTAKAKALAMRDPGE